MAILGSGQVCSHVARGTNEELCRLGGTTESAGSICHDENGLVIEPQDFRSILQLGLPRSRKMDVVAFISWKKGLPFRLATACQF